MHLNSETSDYWRLLSLLSPLEAVTKGVFSTLFDKEGLGDICKLRFNQSHSFDCSATKSPLVPLFKGGN